MVGNKIQNYLRASKMSSRDGGDCTVFKSRINLKFFFFHYSHVLRYIIISIPSESVHLESDPITLIL